jgi:hypothetical protein
MSRRAVSMEYIAGLINSCGLTWSVYRVRSGADFMISQYPVEVLMMLHDWSCHL